MNYPRNPHFERDQPGTKTGFTLKQAETELALKNALRYIPENGMSS